MTRSSTLIDDKMNYDFNLNIITIIFLLLKIKDTRNIYFRTSIKFRSHISKLTLHFVLCEMPRQVAMHPTF